MINGVLLDLSGVIYFGDHVYPGTVEALSRLREAGLPIRFLTNTTRTPKQAIIDRLDTMGVQISDGELFTPARAARDWLARHKRSPYLLVHPDLMKDFRGLATYDDTAVVIGDAGTGFTYDTLNAAFRELMGGAEFLALAANRTFRDDDGELSLDAGAFVAALEFATKRSATVLGKPSSDLFSAALASMECQPGRAVMVGDDAEMDVSGALANGIAHGVLVRTGKYQAGDEARVDPGPTAVVADFAEAVDWILERRG